MRKYPNAVTKKCSKCGRTFTCKGEGWRKKDKCQFEFGHCNCERCHHGKSRQEGCEEINLKEEVQFT